MNTYNSRFCFDLQVVKGEPQGHLVRGARPPGGWEMTPPSFHLFYVTDPTLPKLEAKHADLLAIYSPALGSSPRLLSVEHFIMDGRVLPGQGDATELEQSPAGRVSDCQNDLLLSRRAEFVR